ncbi:uncharacterized protein LOC129916984 [Episyrphus balteatus]|uniref:uncharacterized protein LOC129916984 n=1 Tax=Episyrphus balteatus TaxID=286459 RepID=UPI0024865289|nr:uncharacterized protein LOC129916984 [Episyrphus balteatus]
MIFTTTYRQDFNPPLTQRYNFLRTQKDEKDEKTSSKGCACNVDTQISIPAAALDKCDSVEWNSMAPVGKLVNPRLLPSQGQEFTKNDKADGCKHDQPNRFLKILRTCYPDLYERLKATPPKELNRRLDMERLKTTYQIDYGNENEYPEGIYDNLDGDGIEEKKNKQLDGILEEEEDACAKFKSGLTKEMTKDNLNDDECQQGYKPVKYSFADSSRFSSSGNFSHWAAPPLIKKTTFSEYMDTISKTGCVITKNNIHSHTKCQNGKNCRHKLRHTCPLLK